MLSTEWTPTGDSRLEAYKYGAKRMLQVGVMPLTLETLVSEWMHDWNIPKAGNLLKVYTRYGAMIGGISHFYLNVLMIRKGFDVRWAMTSLAPQTQG